MIKSKELEYITIEKIDKMNFMKIVKFSASKDTLNKVKRQLTKRRKISVNHVSNKELISRI